MRIKNFMLALLIAALASAQARADEGMWLLNMIGKNYKQMKAQGFRLKAKDIYNIKKSSLKDAVCVFGGYCTGEIVSDKGLIFTNHHCGYTAIQQHSSLDHDYLKDGFWAMTQDQEIPTPGLYISILQEISDVTGKILDGLAPGMDEAKRQLIIHSNQKAVEEEFAKKYASDYYEIEVKPFFEGNAYYLMVYTRYDDVRMVGTPPDAIGKFGGDTDNWMWPRHTCDFSVFRVYTDPSGAPAAYSPSNIPMKPKHFLPISLKGYKEGDFAMVMGFPGTTQRYSTSFEIESDMLDNASRAKIRGIRQDVLKADMEASPEIRIQYATKYSQSSNYWKNAIEANKSLKALNIVAEKQKQEASFEQWCRQQPGRAAEYGGVLQGIKEASQRSLSAKKNQMYISECLLQGMELIMHGYHILSFVSQPGNKTREQFISECRDFYKNYSKTTDYKASLAMARLYVEDVDPEYHPRFLKSSSVQAAIDTMFSSPLSTQEGFDKFMKSPSRLALADDPMIRAMRDVLAVYFQVEEMAGADEEALSSARRLYCKAIGEMSPAASLYPDANFSERLTYGKVLSYKDPAWKPGSPSADGKQGDTFIHYTTTQGVLQKEKPGDFEFDVPARLHGLLQAKDFGPYADADGTLHACFLTDNDITGGNSGSPVIDASGNLIGLAFDGNSEAMCSDWIFRPDVQRCISVDIRYVLFVIDKFAGCQRIISELKIVK